MVPLKHTQPIGQIILDLLQGKTTIKDAPTYGELYQAVCRERGSKVSRRDFQKDLDEHQRNNRIQVERDPHNRSATRIFLPPRVQLTPGDRKQALAWWMERYLEDLLKAKIWLREITVPYGGDIEKTELVRKKLSLKELITNHPVWRGYSEAEAKEILSISIATWTPIYRKYAGNRSLLEKPISEYGDLIVKVNVKEIMDAWKENRSVDRQKIIQNLRKTLAAYARGESQPTV
jgi:hypothetical protein